MGAFAVLVFALVTVPMAALAHPPESPEHGLNETTYCSLWAGDDDTESQPYLSDPNASHETCELAASTDVPLDSPPEAAERWNREELDSFPTTSGSRSVYPSGADLQDSTLIADAYIESFAIQPSTRVRLSPGETPHYVAANGTVLATVDYRVAFTGDEPAENTTVELTGAAHEIAETRLIVDNTTVSTTNGTHTPSHPYALAASNLTPNRPHRFTVEADIRVGAQKLTTTCTETTNGTCEDSTTTVEQVNETLTVRDSRDVVGYDLDVSGYRGTYPNGDRGMVVYKNRPWLGYGTNDASVRGVWRFYSARDMGWDTLITSTEDGQTERHSPIHPLGVHAYPFEPGATVSSVSRIELLDTFGTETTRPTLPQNVSLDTVSESYTASYGLATRFKDLQRNETVTAYGLVRGSEANTSREPFAEVPIHESNLTLTVVNKTDDTVTVRAHLHDATTNVPIDTSDSEGFLIVQGTRLNTDTTGTVETTLPRPSGGISARYEPESWWDSSSGYVGDTAMVSLGPSLGSLWSTIYAFAIQLGVFCCAVFLVDRVMGWRVWPPWRGL